jgi:hypothetical protein
MSNLIKSSFLPLTEFLSVMLNVVKHLLRVRIRIILTKRVKYLFSNSTVKLNHLRSLVPTNDVYWNGRHPDERKGLPRFRKRVILTKRVIGLSCNSTV